MCANTEVTKPRSFASVASSSAGFSPGQRGQHLVIGFAVLDLLQQADRFALDHAAGGEGAFRQHEAIDRIAVAARGPDREAIGEWIGRRHVGRAQQREGALVVGVLARRTGFVLDQDAHLLLPPAYTDSAMLDRAASIG